MPVHFLKQMVLPFVDLVCYPPVGDSVCENLSMREILVLRSTCRGLFECLRIFYEKHKLLFDFVKNPSGFLRNLGECNGVVTGEFVRQFFVRKHSVEHMAIYFCHLDEKQEEMGAVRFLDYLFREEGYLFEDGHRVGSRRFVSILISVY